MKYEVVLSSGGLNYGVQKEVCTEPVCILVSPSIIRLKG